MQLGYLMVFLPLLGAVLSGFFGKIIGVRNSEIITSFFVSISAIISLFTWINSGSFNASWSIYIDSLSSLMFVVITIVSSLVHIYSIGYMSHDPHKTRFMSYLSLFTFSMLILVSSDNFLQLFFGWEGVGLCSYLLIGFWFIFHFLE
jgi:NADH-quinone oxidoreductase subunit L